MQNEPGNNAKKIILKKKKGEIKLIENLTSFWCIYYSFFEVSFSAFHWVNESESLVTIRADKQTTPYCLLHTPQKNIPKT